MSVRRVLRETRRFFLSFMPTKKESGAKSPRKTAARKKTAVRKPAAVRVPQTQHSQLAALLKKFEEQVANKETRISVADYIRLLQMKRELEGSEVRDVKVTWVEQNASEE
jgi:hypothetical protein